LTGASVDSSDVWLLQRTLHQSRLTAHAEKVDDEVVVCNWRLLMTLDLLFVWTICCWPDKNSCDRWLCFMLWNGSQMLKIKLWRYWLKAFINRILLVVYSLITRADENRGSKAFFLVRPCLQHDRTKMAETTITKLLTGIVHHKSWIHI